MREKDYNNNNGNNNNGAQCFFARNKNGRNNQLNTALMLIDTNKYSSNWLICDFIYSFLFCSVVVIVIVVIGGGLCYSPYP